MTGDLLSKHALGISLTSLEYDIFHTTEQTERKSCSIREQIIGIAVVSKRDFDNVTCDWRCSSYAL